MSAALPVTAGEPLLSVGIISADLGRVNEHVAEIAEAGAQMLHVDVMDGHFCPGLTVGPGFVAALETPLLLDIHLLVNHPLQYVDAFADAGADLITIHLEATTHPLHALEHIEGRGLRRGLALLPSTPVSAVAPLLDDIDLVLLVAVNPGHTGQRPHRATTSRAAEAQYLAAQRSPRPLIGIDGGITIKNAADVTADADVVVAGSAVFDNGGVAANLTTLRDHLRNSRRPDTTQDRGPS